MRTITTSVRNDLESSHGGPEGDFLVMFARITHALLAAPILVVNDVVDYVWGGETYTGLPFELALLSDGDRAPSAKLRMQNVDGAIGRLVTRLKTSPSIQLDVLSTRYFGDAISGVRTEVPSPTPVVEYSAPRLRLRNVQGDANFIEADLWTWDLSREPYPAIRSTKDRLPGLYR